EGQPHPRRCRQAARGRRLGEHLQPLRPREPLRRLQGVRLRPRGWPPRPRRIPRVLGMGCLRCVARAGPARHHDQEGRQVMSHLTIPKTYKLYIGGKFPRSESGRTYEVATAKGEFLANAAKASRKDARDAVVAARKALDGWAGATGYNRGQVLYRIAELLEGRRAQFIDEVRRSEGVSEREAGRQVDAAIDTWVWYAGWADKYVQVAGNGNPVTGPYFKLSTPEPTGVVAIIAPQESSL